MVSWDLIIFIVEALLKSESQSIVNSNVTDVLLQISTTTKTTTNAKILSEMEVALRYNF